MRGERAQVTIFVAIGLVLLFVVAVFFLVIDAEQRAEQEYEQGQALVEGSQSAELTSAIGSCIDTIVHDELRALGRSGGLQSDEQAYPRAIVSSGVTSGQVIYGLTRNRDVNQPGMKKPFIENMPIYPAEGFSLTNQLTQLPGEHPFATWQTGYFGDVHFAPVCSKTGPNSPTSARACRSYSGMPPSVPKGKSTQERLNDRLLPKISACANVDRFSESLGLDIQDIGEPEISVAFTYSNVLVTVAYPLQIVGKSQTQIQEIRRTYDVRYMPLAQFARDIALEESRNLTFDPATDYSDLPSWRPGMSVATRDIRVSPQTTLSPPIHENATVVTVIDSKSKIDGDTFGFNFLMEHRPPVLVTPAIGCAYAKNNPLSTVLAGDTEGYDPDGIGVEFAWCHEKYSDCPSTDMTLLVWDDSLQPANWQDWTDWYTIAGGCPAE